MAPEQCQLYNDAHRRVLGPQHPQALGQPARDSPHAPEIVLTLRRAGGPDEEVATVAIQDHGIGLAQADLPLRFEPFRRGANVAHRVAGTGIGPYSARRIVEQRGGSITIPSRKGKGTTVTVHLPLT